MADFTIREGTDWITTIAFGAVGERWSLDDFDLRMTLRKANDDSEVLTLDLANGGLVIADGPARHLEINAFWEQLTGLAVGPYEFDVLFVNRTTGLKDRSDIFTVEIVRGITKDS